MAIISQYSRLTPISLKLTPISLNYPKSTPSEEGGVSLQSGRQSDESQGQARVCTGAVSVDGLAVRAMSQSGLMILGGRRGSMGGSGGPLKWLRGRSTVQRLRTVVTMLMTIAPPTAGQNPDTVNPFTR